MSRNKKIAFFVFILLLTILPLLVLAIKQSTQTRSNAAAADKLEAEGGALGGNAVIQSDSTSSGGNFIVLKNNQTPTTTPTPTINQTGTIYNIPTGIDGSGNTNVSTAIQAFVNSVPNGSAANPSIIKFPTGKTYQLQPGINYGGKSYIIFDGSGTPTQYGNTGGATLKASGNGIKVENSPFYAQYPANDIIFKNFNLIGSNPHGATNLCWNGESAQNSGGTLGEYQMGISMRGAKNIEIANMNIDKMQGDHVYLGTVNTGLWNENIWIHNIYGNNNGRMALGIIGVNNLRVEDSKFENTCMYVFDQEPNYGNEGTTNATYRRNIIGNYAYSTAFGESAVLDTYSPATSANFGSVTFENNTITGKPIGRPIGQSPIYMKLLEPNQTGTWIIRNNTCTSKGIGPAIRINNSSASFTITNNTGCLSTGSFISTESNFTGTIIQNGNN